MSTGLVWDSLAKTMNINIKLKKLIESEIISHQACTCPALGVVGVDIDRCMMTACSFHDSGVHNVRREAKMAVNHSKPSTVLSDNTHIVR